MVSGLFARINDRDYEIVNGSANYSLDSSNQFTFSVLASELNWRGIRGIDVEIWNNGELFTSGFVDKSPKLKIKDGSTIVVSLKCLDELARLTLERAKSEAHYQDQEVLGIVNDLFTSIAANWTISLVNMVDPLIKTTVDLRNKETLFAQISEAIRSVPDLHMRYGGFNVLTSDYILEIGNFNDVTEEAIQHSNLLNVNVQYSTNKIYKTVESFGDLTPTTRINLNDALSDPRTILHPDYAQFPISADPITGVYICTNVAIATGSNIRKSMNVIKTKNDVAPLASEVAAAGYALWLKTVRLMKSSVDSESYSGDFLSKNIPKVGDKMHLKSTITEPVYDLFTGKFVENFETFSVDDNFRITKIDHDFNNVVLPSDSFNFENDYRKFGFEVTSIDEAEEIDPDLEMYERLERFNNYDNISGSVEVSSIQITTQTYGNGNAADCNAAGGAPPPNDGKRYLKASPSYPGWATNVTTWYTISNGGIIKTLTEPVVPGDDWDACVQDSTGSWPPPIGGDIIITVYWLFT